MDPVLEYALENKDYFNWPIEIKQEACFRLASWITGRSLKTQFSRNEIIVQLLNDAESEGEYEYCAFVNDVATFFSTKNWDHLEKRSIKIDN